MNGPGQPDFKHRDENDTFIQQEDWPQVETLVDWLVAIKRAGYKMSNSVSRRVEMKEFKRGKTQKWNCRAGQDTLIIRTDGTLAPCFPLYNATYDTARLDEAGLRVSWLLDTGFSTLNHIVAYCYNDARVMRWLLKQALNRFQGVSNFE